MKPGMPRATHQPQISHAEYGFRVWHGVLPKLPQVVTHPEIQINFVLHGFQRYFLVGHFLTIKPRRFTVFWGGMPHQLIDQAPHTEVISVTVPLSWFMRWKLAASVQQRLLLGESLEEPDQSPATMAFDRALLERWSHDLRADNAPELRRIAELEVEARLRRLALSVAHEKPKQSQRAPASTGRNQLERVIAYLGEHSADIQSVAEIATAVGLHPNYLMQLFKSSTGLTLWDYVLRLRISNAQRLLLTTDLKVVDVALESGFQYVNNFHVVFRRICQCTPRRYREKQEAR